MKYLFVMGVPRSGTTIISNTISKALNSCSIVNTWSLYSRISRRFPIIMQPLTRMLRKIGISKDFLYSTDYIWKELKRLNEKQSMELLGKYLTCTRNEKKVVVNKRIANVKHLDIIQKKINNASIIHVKRDPLDTIKSIIQQRFLKKGSRHKRWGVFIKNHNYNNKDYILDVTHQYLEIYNQVEFYSNIIKDSCSVQYEQFCLNTKKTIQKIGSKYNLKMSDLVFENIVLKKYDHDDDFVKKVCTILLQSNNDDLIKYAENKLRNINQKNVS